MEQHIKNIQALLDDLKKIENPNSHDRDAITRCTTLLRSLNQSAALKKQTSAVVNDANAQIEAALKTPVAPAAKTAAPAATNK